MSHVFQRFFLRLGMLFLDVLVCFEGQECIAIGVDKFLPSLLNEQHPVQTTLGVIWTILRL
jgi:hypothetical protein